jgi:hypothetical protein
MQTILRSLLVALSSAGLLATVAPPAAGQEREGPRPPGQTDRGRFEGTWVRVEPGERHGVQLRRADDGAWEVRLYWEVVGEIKIDTAWERHHDYVYNDYPGFFELDVLEEKSDDDRLIVSYRREADGRRNAHMVETGDITLYRGGVEGRTLVWIQDPLVRTVEVADALYPDEAENRTERRKVWLFHKQTERTIPWDEVYW